MTGLVAVWVAWSVIVATVLVVTGVEEYLDFKRNCVCPNFCAHCRSKMP